MIGTVGVVWHVQSFQQAQGRLQSKRMHVPAFVTLVSKGDKALGVTLAGSTHTAAAMHTQRDIC